MDTENKLSHVHVGALATIAFFGLLAAMVLGARDVRFQIVLVFTAITAIHSFWRAIVEA